MRWGSQSWRQKGGAGHKLRVSSDEGWIYIEQLLGQRWIGMCTLDPSAFFKSIGTKAQLQICSIPNMDRGLRDTQAYFLLFFSSLLRNSSQCWTYLSVVSHSVILLHCDMELVSLSIQHLLFWRFLFHVFFQNNHMWRSGPRNLVFEKTLEDSAPGVKQTPCGEDGEQGKCLIYDWVT